MRLLRLRSDSYTAVVMLPSCVVGRGNESAERKGGPEMADAAETGEVTLEQLKKKMAEFARERDWDQFHSPRNLLLAMVGEVGELSEIFQWKGEVPRGLPDWEDKEKQHLGEELSDVLLYLVRLADICGIDLGKAALRKLQLNANKYPVKLCKGSSEKYTQICQEGDSGNGGHSEKESATIKISDDVSTLFD